MAKKVVNPTAAHDWKELALLLARKAAAPNGANRERWGNDEGLMTNDEGSPNQEKKRQG
jgi:hypothetical protein